MLEPALGGLGIENSRHAPDRLNYTFYDAPMAKLDKASAYEAGDCRFESCSERQTPSHDMNPRRRPLTGRCPPGIRLRRPPRDEDSLADPATRVRGWPGLGPACMALLVALGGCGEEPPADGGPSEPAGEAGSEPADRAGFYLFCGRCGEDPLGLDLFRSDFSAGFLGEHESCAHAPFKLVDGDTGTGWAEGAEGMGIGTRVVVPKRLVPNAR